MIQICSMQFCRYTSWHYWGYFPFKMPLSFCSHSFCRAQYRRKLFIQEAWLLNRNAPYDLWHLYNTGICTEVHQHICGKRFSPSDILYQLPLLPKTEGCLKLLVQFKTALRVTDFIILQFRFLSLWPPCSIQRRFSNNSKRWMGVCRHGSTP